MARVFHELPATMSHPNLPSLDRAQHRLATQLRQARCRRCWTQREFAAQIGASVNTVRRIERGDPGTSLSTLMRSALHLGLLREFNHLLKHRDRHRRDRCARPAPLDVGATAATTSEHETADASTVLECPPQSAVEAQEGSLAAAFTVYLGEQAVVLGTLRFYAKGDQIFSEFSYSASWLKSERFFTVSPDLAKSAKRQRFERLLPGSLDVFAALADAIPSGFAGRVVAQASARGIIEIAHGQDGLPSALHGLRAMPDAARLGALRLAAVGQSPDDPLRVRSTLLWEADLNHAAQAAAAMECGVADARDLSLLLRSSAALGGDRPKGTWVQKDDSLWIAKFPSNAEGALPNRAEILGMKLAKEAGIHAIDVKLLEPLKNPILVAPRFDRSAEGRRAHFLSARGLMGVNAHAAVSHRDLLKAMRAHGKDFPADAAQVWLRLALMCLIHQPGDALRKIGFLHDGDGRWRLVPAYGLRLHVVSQQLLRERQNTDQGAMVKLQVLMREASAFGIEPQQACDYLQQMLKVLTAWKYHASQYAVYMRAVDIARFEPAMNHSQVEGTRLLMKMLREIREARG